MNNVSKQIRQAYYDALNGHISKEVFKEDVPEGYHNHYVLIRLESETTRHHSSGFYTNPIIVTEVVGIFKNSVDPDVVDDIDGEIRAILLPDVGSRTFNVNGIQISNIKIVDSTFFSEDDGSKRYYRKITRWQQRISHT